MPDAPVLQQRCCKVLYARPIGSQQVSAVTSEPRFNHYTESKSCGYGYWWLVGCRQPAAGPRQDTALPPLCPHLEKKAEVAAPLDAHAEECQTTL